MKDNAVCGGVHVQWWWVPIHSGPQRETSVPEEDGGFCVKFEPKEMLP